MTDGAAVEGAPTRSTPPSTAERARRRDALERAITGRSLEGPACGADDADVFELGELEPEDDGARELVVYDLPFD